MFWCLPDSSKCEWRKLESFVKRYNILYKADYKLSECLDVFDKKKPQPELKLKALGKKDIVIEHKIITWPPNYLELHNAEHEFRDFFFKAACSEFQDDIYVLDVNSADIIPKKRTLQKWANKIAKMVINRKDRIRNSGGIYSSEPIRWLFKRLPENERDEDIPRKGIGVRINGAFESIDFENFESESIGIKGGVKSTLISHLEKSSIKFRDYKDCIRIFITEVHGEHLLLGYELIEELLPLIKPPSNIDQIWVGFPEWKSEFDFETSYKLIMDNCQY